MCAWCAVKVTRMVVSHRVGAGNLAQDRREERPVPSRWAIAPASRLSVSDSVSVRPESAITHIDTEAQGGECSPALGSPGTGIYWGRCQNRCTCGGCAYALNRDFYVKFGAKSKASQVVLCCVCPILASALCTCVFAKPWLTTLLRR